MIILIKLLLAHLIGDFILQPNAWVADKEQRKQKSIYLYLHLILHFALAWILVGDLMFATFAAILAILHGCIDLSKLHFQRKKTKRGWFIADQILHIIVIIIIAMIWNNTDFSSIQIDNRFYICFTGFLLLTTPASIIIKNIISIWTPNENDTNGSSNREQSQQSDLQNAGKYIGILERLFVFFFILSGNFAAIGFLMAAKSIFRFGDLTQSKDRRLTEYVLIGTLLSFAIAIATGYLVQYALSQLSQNPFIN